MRLRRLEVENFRGIAKLDWKRIGDTAALVGPGDSCKSTILDAIERVLSPRWNLQFDDSDFYALNVDAPIVIRATVGDLPRSFARDSKFGLALQALEADGATSAVKKETKDFAIVIELRVESSLEPVWQVIDGESRPHAIQAKDREELGMLRVGNFVDGHLGWSRGSVLAKLTERGDSVGLVLADATRKTRKNFSQDGLDKLKTAAAHVQAIGASLGVTSAGSLGPHLDVGAIGLGSGALALHDGEVPVRKSGLGTRRLLAMAMQKDAGAKEGLALVDELEHGLEPHRIRKLLRVLRGKPPEKADGAAGQFVFTTHSPTVLSELTPPEVYVARRDQAQGQVKITNAADALATVLKKAPTALLARRVVVGEGITEVGFIHALAEHWEASGRPSLAYRGVEVVDGIGGNQPAAVAGALVQLGYVTALMIDSDGKDKKSWAKDATLLQWTGEVSIEERLALDLPEVAFREMVVMATCSPKGGFAKVRDSIAAALGAKPLTFNTNPREWLDAVDPAKFRVEFGRVAKSKHHGWFKTESMGHLLGELVAQYLDEMVLAPTGFTVAALQTFIHDD